MICVWNYSKKNLSFLGMELYIYIHTLELIFLDVMIAVATPKQIRELMKVDGLTNDEVKSHLQVSFLSLSIHIYHKHTNYTQKERKKSTITNKERRRHAWKKERLIDCQSVYDVLLYVCFCCYSTTTKSALWILHFPFSSSAHFLFFFFSWFLCWLLVRFVMLYRSTDFIREGQVQVRKLQQRQHRSWLS